MQATVEFTHTAERHAHACAILPLSAGFALPDCLQRGDIVEFPSARGLQLFQIRSRHLRIADHGEQRLVFRLDHPVR